jgi:hypothetical protein
MGLTFADNSQNTQTNQSAQQRAVRTESLADTPKTSNSPNPLAIELPNVPLSNQTLPQNPKVALSKDVQQTNVPLTAFPKEVWSKFNAENIKSSPLQAGDILIIAKEDKKNSNGVLIQKAGTVQEVYRFCNELTSTGSFLPFLPSKDASLGRIFEASNAKEVADWAKDVNLGVHQVTPEEIKALKK